MLNKLKFSIIIRRSTSLGKLLQFGDIVNCNHFLYWRVLVMKKIFRSYLEVSLIWKVLIALILGIIIGLIFGESASVISPLGDLLVRLLKFLIVPLILFTIIVGINQSNISNLARMGGKVFTYYLFTSAVAIVIGLTVANIFNPGMGLTLDTNESIEVPENPEITSILLNIVPDNIFTAFTELNLLGIIFTAAVFGIAIALLRSQEQTEYVGELIYNVSKGLSEASFKVMSGILQYLPIGIFAIIAKTVGEQGTDALKSLGSMVGVFYLAIIVQMLFYGFILILYRVNLKEFF